MLGDPSPVFAYQRATSRNPEPYRAHFTHPVSAWVRVHDREHADVILLAEAMGLLDT